MPDDRYLPFNNALLILPHSQVSIKRDSPRLNFGAAQAASRTPASQTTEPKPETQNRAGKFSPFREISEPWLTATTIGGEFVAYGTCQKLAAVFEAKNQNSAHLRPTDTWRLVPEAMLFVAACPFGTRPKRCSFVRRRF